MSSTIDRHRRRIDRIDRRISRLLAKRLGYVLKIGTEKKKKDIAVSDRERERAVLRNVESAVKGGREAQYVRSVYDRIFEESSRQEEAKWTGK